jgi:IPT/TIG domain
MTFRTRTAFRNLLIALSFFVAAVLQGCTGGSNGGGTPPPNTSAPSITSLSQPSGAVGTPVTITGTNFGMTQGTSTVTFSGTAAGTPTSWSATSIAVPVPTGATTGNVVVTVGGVASNGVSFTVTVPPPSITSLSQTSGAVGTAVTITGTNFGTTQGTSTVTFNGTAGTPTSWSATSIAVPVPTGATTGNVVVTVGGVASGGVNFIVTTGSVPAITSSDTATGTIGVAFSYQIAATNSPTSFGAVGLPTGFTLNTVSGLISGTPTGAAFASSVTLTATNTNGTGSGPLTLTINSGGIGTPVSHMIQISNDADDGYYNSQNSTGWHSAPEFGAADLVGSSSGSTTAWVTGYRFPSVGANSGDAIQSAYLQLVSSSSFATNAACGTAPCSNNYTFRVYGVAQDDGSAFSGTAGNTPLDVPYTTAYTDYTSTGPGDAHGSCQGQNNGQNTCTHTIDVTNIVREITSRPGWTNASAMRFALVSTNSSPVNVYAGFEDFSGSASKAATLVVNPAVPTIVSSGAWGTGAHQTYPSSYTVGPFVYPGATTLLLFLGDYYNFYYTPIPQPTVSDSCGNTWGILAGPTDWAGITYDMRSTVYYVQNPISCPAGAAITVATTVQEPIFLHFIAVGGTNTANEPITSAITSPNPGTTTTTATSDSITLTQSGLLVSWIFGDADGGSTPGTGYVFAPQSGFTIDSNSTPNYLTTVFQSAPSAGSYQSQFSISPEDGWQVVIVGLQAP